MWEQPEVWQLSPMALSTLLECDKCEISSENDLFHILRKWLSVDKEERQSHLDQILTSVRWPTMNNHFLNDIVSHALWLQACPSFEV